VKYQKQLLTTQEDESIIRMLAWKWIKQKKAAVCSCLPIVWLEIYQSL